MSSKEYIQKNMFLKRSNKLAMVDFDGSKITFNDMVDYVKYFSNNIFKDIEKKKTCFNNS